MFVFEDEELKEFIRYVKGLLNPTTVVLSLFGFVLMYFSILAIAAFC